MSSTSNRIASPSHRDWLLALHASPGLTHPTACRIVALGVERARHLARRPAELRGAGIPQHAAARLAQLERDLAERVVELERRAAAADARLVTWADDLPASLRRLELPPPVLYVRGALPDAPAVALVGARRASSYGIEVARWLARSFVQAGLTVVSGFAVGVDAAAHSAAVEAGGRTIAVLGCGIDVDYPRGHRRLGNDIVEKGALVTEFPPGSRPASWQFPVRNRLIAALSDACVVVEAAPRSGSLVTARLALEMGRDVLAVPGRVTDELALGTNSLIADGARPLLDPRDAIEAIGLGVASDPDDARREPAGVSGDALALWRAARDGEAAVEELARRADVDVERSLAVLLQLELAGHLRRSPEGRYALIL